MKLIAVGQGTSFISSQLNHRALWTLLQWTVLHLPQDEKTHEWHCDTPGKTYSQFNLWNCNVLSWNITVHSVAAWWSWSVVFVFVFVFVFVHLCILLQFDGVAVLWVLCISLWDKCALSVSIIPSHPGQTHPFVIQHCPTAPVQKKYNINICKNINI